MSKKYFLERLGILQKDFFIIFILLFNAFTWYYITLGIINRYYITLHIITYIESLVILAFYHLAIIGSSIVGSILSSKIRRLRLLYVWMLMGTGISFLPIFVNNIATNHILIIYSLLGTSFGLGMPSCLALFADSTTVENRGRVSGLIFLFTMILFGIFNVIANFVILTLWRGLGLLIFTLLKPEERFAATEMRKSTSFASIFHNKSFVFYLIPWLMFCFIDRFEEPVLNPFLGPISNFIRIIILIITSLSAFIGGLLSDWIGRKRVVLFGFATLGIAYAIIGIAPTELISRYFYLTTAGIATGILWVTLVLILWGDLSQSGTREKYYVIGEIPFFLTGIIQMLSAPYVMLIPTTGAFSLASFFLFLAVLPLLYASETLPERKIELRQLRKYIEAARKVKEKSHEEN